MENFNLKSLENENEKLPRIDYFEIFKENENFLKVIFKINNESYGLQIEITDEDKAKNRKFFEIFLNFLVNNKDLKNFKIEELPRLLKKLAEESMGNDKR
jgi:hypothetical protein